jgi:hypothetical protein
MGILMKVRAALWLAAAGLIAACNSDANPSGPRIIDDGEGGGGFSLSGTVYGFTGGPDSQRVELSGVVVSVVRLAALDPDTSIVDPDSGVTNPDTVVVPPPDSIVLPDSIACPITWLCARQAGGRMAFTLDTVFPPPSSCFDTGEVITATSDASGSFTLAGLEDGLYGLKVEPASGSGYQGFTYCGGIILTENRPDPLNFYLSAAP